MSPFSSLPVIPNLYLGLSLASHHLPPDQLDSFMRRMLVSRISRRVLAEHHLALSMSFSSKSSGNPLTSDSHHPGNIGIIYTNLSVKSSIVHCVQLLKSRPHHVVDPGSECGEGWPSVHIDGHEDTHFSYIKEHLDYIVFELLKNVSTFLVISTTGNICIIGPAFHNFAASGAGQGSPARCHPRNDRSGP